MPAPFPGMDPYLEAPEGWSGVHLALLAAIQSQLNRILPADFTAKLDQYVWAVARSNSSRRSVGRPDVLVPTQTPRRSTISHATAALASAPTASTRLPKPRARTHRHLKIVTERGAKVVTVVEVLSPSNKAAGVDREAYLRKRNEYLLSEVNLVEIDLLRGGTRLPLGEPAPLETDYAILIQDVTRPLADVWGFQLRDTIPVIPVPLTSEHLPVPLDLRSCLDRVYEDGRYGVDLDYTQPPVPPLRPNDAEWAAELLAKRGGQ